MMSNSGFGHADAHSYNATSSLGLDLEGLRANLDQLAAGELERSQSPTWRVERNPISGFDEAYDEDEEARRPIVTGGQHRLISNYGTAWTNEVSATSRVALEVPRVSLPSKPVMDSSEKKSPKSKPRDKKAAKTEAEGKPMAEPEAEEEVTAEGETEGSSNTLQALREDEYVVQDGETLNGLALHLDTTARVLKRLNKLTGDSIYAGQVLKIPMMRKQFSAAVEVEEVVGPQDGELVQVIDKKGFTKQVWRKKDPGKSNGRRTPPGLAAKHLTGFFEPR